MRSWATVVGSFEKLADLWSTTRFPVREQAAYAERLILGETRDGVRTMSLVLLLMLLTSLLLHDRLGFSREHVYTAGLLSILCTHVYLAARGIGELRTLHVLGLTLLVMTGLGFLLLAHRAGALDAAVFTTAALLFMAIPMVPWGLREGLIGTLLVFGMFSASTWAAASRFSEEALWALEAFMLVAGAVSLTLVGRAARVRKDDLVARYELQQAQRESERRSLQDPLTGAWNRRFLELEFHAALERAQKSGESLYLAILDLDGFKQLNDSHGHVVGDQALCWLTRAYVDALGDAGHLARAGGDEFVLLFTSDAPEELFARACEATNALARHEGGAAAPAIAMSVGLVALDARHSTLEHSYRRADAALYRAKSVPAGGPASLRLAWAEPREAPALRADER